MLPASKPSPTNYQTLEEIRQRKEELLAELQADNKQFSEGWNSLFTRRKDASRGDYLATLVSHSVTAIDVILTLRKLINTYGWLTGKTSRRKRR